MSLETEAWLHPHKQPEAIPYNLGALQTNSSLLTRIALKQLSKDQEGWMEKPEEQQKSSR